MHSGTATPLSNASFASDAASSVSGAQDDQPFRQQQQQQVPVPPRRRRKSDLNNGDSGIELIRPKTATHTTPSTATAGSTTHPCNLSVQEGLLHKSAQTADNKKERNSGSEKCAPPETLTMEAASTHESMTSPSSSASSWKKRLSSHEALKNFEHSPILNNKKDNNGNPIRQQNKQKQQQLIQQVSNPSAPAATNEHSTLAATVNNDNDDIGCTNTSQRDAAHTDVDPYVRTYKSIMGVVKGWWALVHNVWIVRILVLFTMWLASLVLPIKRLSLLSSSSSTVVVLFWGLIRIEFPAAAASDDDSCDGKEVNQTPGQEPSDNLYHSNSVIGEDASTPGSPPNVVTVAEVAELRRGLSKLDVRLTSTLTSVNNVKQHVSSLEGVVGGLHYMVEQHDAALRHQSTNALDADFKTHANTTNSSLE